MQRTLGQDYVWNTTLATPCLHLTHLSIKMTSCLKSQMREREMQNLQRRRKKEQQNSRKQAFTRRMPTPSSCRVPAWHRCSGPISSLCSFYLRVSRIWLVHLSFMALSGGSTVLLERRRGFLQAGQRSQAYRLIIVEVPNRHIKVNKERSVELSADYFP